MDQREQFQKSVWSTLEQMALAELMKTDDEVPDESPTVYGFNHPWPIVLETFEAWRNHGVLPWSGGWLEQSPLWREDMRQLTAVYNYLVLLHKDRKSDAT